MRTLLSLRLLPWQGRSVSLVGETERTMLRQILKKSAGKVKQRIIDSGELCELLRFDMPMLLTICSCR